MTTDDRKLLELLQDSGLSALVERTLGGAEGDPEAAATARYARFAARLSARRFVVPVVGVQGSGKSTLLNAIAFDRPVLPVDVDETTCVPVEIRWAKRPSAEAMVRYRDGREERVPAEERSLAAVVHNDHNPGNERGIDRVILESSAVVLESGLVLVDLPGTGSLTAANFETTRRYLDEAVGVSFLLRTVPPLTRSEALFVSFQWARLPAAFFVQNRWTDETNQEAESGRNHNATVLEDLARRNRIPLSGAPTVHVVNAYRAFEGVLKREPGVVAAAGLPEFLERLGRGAQEWPTLLRSGIAGALEADLLGVREALARELQQLSTDRAKLEVEMREESERFDRYIRDVRERSAAAVDSTSTLVEERKRVLSKWSKDGRSAMRNTMRSKLRAGIVDGSRLERAMRDEQSVALEDALIELQEAILAHQDSVRERFAGVEAWRVGRPDPFHTVKRPEKAKWESLVPTVVGAGAALAGGVGGKAAGAWIGGIIGSAGGPPGAIIGGIVGGILGGVIGAWVGGRTRRVVLEQRAKAVEGEVFAAVDSFFGEAERGLREQLDGFAAGITSGLARWEAEQVSRFEAERQRTATIRDEGQTEHAARMERVRADDLLAEAGLARLRAETRP